MSLLFLRSVAAGAPRPVLSLDPDMVAVVLFEAAGDPPVRALLATQAELALAPRRRARTTGRAPRRTCAGEGWR